MFCVGRMRKRFNIFLFIVVILKLFGWKLENIWDSLGGGRVILHSKHFKAGGQVRNLFELFHIFLLGDLDHKQQDYISGL